MNEALSENIFGERVRMMRRHIGYTQTALGDMIGATKATVSNYESGKIYPPLDIAFKIAKALDVPFTWLVGIDEYIKLY